MCVCVPVRRSDHSRSLGEPRTQDPSSMGYVIHPPWNSAGVSFDPVPAAAPRVHQGIEQDITTGWGWGCLRNGLVLWEEPWSRSRET